MLELIFSLCLLIFSILLYINTGNLPSASLSQGGGAGFYPRFVLLLLIFLTIIYIIENRKKIFSVRQEFRENNFKELIKKNKYWLYFVVLLLLVPWMLQYLGFRITGIFAVFTGSVIIKFKNNNFKKKDLILIIIVSIVIVFAISILFENYLRFPLPKFNLF